MGIESPYKFLDYYDLDDRPRFFGRGRESNILVADVVVNRLVVLFARSGTGKTSLINAGVRPLLEARDFRTFYIRVEQNPTEAARDVLQKEKLLGRNTEEVPLSTQLAAIVKSLDKPIVLFFDQFEEFFIQIHDRETRRQFISDIAKAYRDAASGVHLVFSMREEYFHEMDEFRTEIPSIFHKNSNLRLLDFEEAQARDAITKPLEPLDVAMQPTLVEALLRDLAQEGRINPTTLQIVCDTLWRKRNVSTNEITLDLYENKLGGWRQILDQRLEEDIEGALGETDLLPLMQGLIPELRTAEGTKYPRVISDLIKILGTSETSLKALTARLKDIHVIREVSVSRSPAIEWASDYLAARTRTEYLLVRVKAIDIKRRLRLAIASSSAARLGQKEAQAAQSGRTVQFIPEDVLEALYLPKDSFEEFSQDIAFLTDLDIEAAKILFDAALFHRNHMKLWFDRATYAGIDPWDILQAKIHDQATHINLRLGSVRLLADVGTEQALVLLGEALQEPDLALDVVDALVGIPGEQAEKHIATALAREDLWVAAMTNLTRTNSERAARLLEPLLEQDVRFPQVLDAFERLANSPSSATGARAQKALVKAVKHLESQAQQDEFAARAQKDLQRLASSGYDQVAASANKALKRLASVPGTQRQPVNVPPTKELDATSSRVLERTRLRRSALHEAVEATPSHGSLKETSPREWDRMIRFISQGKIIPVISNSFRIEQIFAGVASDESASSEDDLTVEEQVTREWGRFIDYPMPDDHNLARVAGYYLAEQGDSWAKEDYINFLKQMLLLISENDPYYYEDMIGRLKSRLKEMRFSEIVYELDLPRFPDGKEDSFRLLARFPLPVYVTTSYHDFLERALIAEGKKPRTQVIFWHGETDVKPEHSSDPDFRATPIEPVVYHLYGLEDYPQTLVLSEDDHLNFLKSVAADTNTMEPIIPLRLRQALAESSLIFLGYNQRALDFRILLNVFSNFRRGDFSPRGTVVLPVKEKSGDLDKSLEYLKRYFDKSHFGFERASAESFVDQLWKEWEKYGRGLE